MKFEIWAMFEDGLEIKVETHNTMESAQIAIDAIAPRIERELIKWCGFKHGTLTFIIK